MENRINKEILDCQSKKDLITEKYDKESKELRLKQEELLTKWIKSVKKINAQSENNVSTIRESYKDNK